MERLWLTRMRWRLRGALLWPCFVLFCIVDALLLTRLPVYGTGPDGLVPALLASVAINLACVAVLAPLGGRLVRRGRPDLPRAVAADAAGAALLGLLAAGLVLGGLDNRAEVRHEHRALQAQADAVARYVHAQAPRYRSGLTALDTVRLGPDQYRTCVPGADPDRWLCLIVDTDQEPPGVARDGDERPNVR